MDAIVVDVLERVGIPALTLLGGWFGHKFRSKQQKESDILENMKQILEAQTAYIERQDTRYRELEEHLYATEHKLDNKRASIGKANKCKFTNEDEGCPVLAHEDYLDEKCKQCELKKSHDNGQD